MSIFNLINEKHPTLKNPGSDFIFGKEDTGELYTNMLVTMHASNGVGLAAHQIGRAENFFVMEYENKSHIIFNPKPLTYSDGTIIYEEGCLSFPHLFFKVKRPDWVIAAYQDEKGDWKENKFDGFLGRIFLHEFDHTQGICFVDRVGKTTLDLAVRRKNKKLTMEK